MLQETSLSSKMLQHVSSQEIDPLITRWFYTLIFGQIKQYVPVDKKAKNCIYNMLDISIYYNHSTEWESSSEVFTSSKHWHFPPGVST